MKIPDELLNVVDEDAHYEDAHEIYPREVLDAVPDGWLKIDGQWIEVEPITHDADDAPGGKESHTRFCVDQETFYARKDWR